MMTDPGFLKSLVEFDKDGLSEKQVKRVKTEYMKDPSFTYDNIRNVSTAGSGGFTTPSGLGGVAAVMAAVTAAVTAFTCFGCVGPYMLTASCCMMHTLDAHFLLWCIHACM